MAEFAGDSSFEELEGRWKLDGAPENRSAGTSVRFGGTLDRSWRGREG
jgi:hypothetical protein